MKKIFVVMVIMLLFLSGCTNEVEDGYNNVDLLETTYQFSGNSKNFSFDIGKVNFSNNEKDILIKGFKQKNKIKNLSNIKFIISFDNNIWSTQENNKKMNKINSIMKNIIFYERGIICTQDSGINCEETFFSRTTKDDFKTKIKIEVEYCTNENTCKIEQFNLSYEE